MAPMIDDSPNTKELHDLSDYAVQGKGSVLQQMTKKNQLPPLSTVVDLFEHQVLLHPFEPAIETENQPSISFSRLKLLSNRVASALPAQPGLIIPICVDRSIELIASILGVLASGAAYAILDPTGSYERNKFIIEEVQASIVITSKKYSELYLGAVAIEDLMDETASRRRSGGSYAYNDQRCFDPTSPAYVIYTSGTTGKPKGVVISHAAASYGINHFSLRGKSRWLLFFNPVFSAAQRTILATLCKGGCVCLTSKDRLSTSLLEVISNMRIDSLGVTPSMLATLSPKNIPSCLKQITTVGEPVSESILETWADIVELRVSYGLSECAQLNFARRLSKGDNPSLIGQPNDTTDAFILIPGTTKLASLGQVGELCLAGPQLSDGYLNRPLETAKSFVQNPFGLGRMFRTGDLAVRDSNDNIEILGRLDNQIKLHGQRLEPEEVSSVLNMHKSVVATAVVAAHVGESKALVAAIATDPEYDWSLLVAELRLKAQELLPPYMVPSFWLRFERLPTNANGKVDTRNIRAQAECNTPDEMLGRASCDKRPPEVVVDKVEIQIRLAWAEVLNIEPDSISRHDSFFALGGNSMQAIRMINSLRHTGVELSLEDIFRHQDLAALRAQAVVQSASLSANEKTSLPFSMVLDEELAVLLSKRKGLIDAYPVTALQESLISLTLQGSSDYLYQRIWDVKHLDLFRLKLAFQVAFMRSDILRTTFEWTTSGLMQFVRDDLQLPWKTLDMSLEEYKRSDQKTGVVLGEVFWRAAVLHGQILVVTMHHSLFDLWSSSFIYEDISALYHGLDPEPRPAFKNFVQKTLKLDSKAADTFWEQHLTNASPTLLNSSLTAEKLSVTRKVANNLDQIAAWYNVTASTIVHLAWALIISRHLDSNDVTFASTLSGRETYVDGIDRLDGPTLTVIPRRFQLDPQATVEELLLTAHNESLLVMKHSQHGMRNALKAAGATAGLIDSMINIHPPSNSQVRKHATNVFQRFREKGTWQTEYATLEVAQDCDVVVFTLNARIEAMRAEFILDQLTQTIAKISREPKTLLKSLSIITEREIGMMTAPKSFSAVLPQVLQAGFEAHANTHPLRVALQWQNEELLTYRMLNYRANKLARHFQKEGLKAGDYACLLLEKSPMMIVAILAVLKVGAAYVPLSPDNPIDRNAFIVEEVGAKVILSDSSIAQSAMFESPDTILLNEVDISKYSNTPLNTAISGDSIAYVIYTSGSTGKPKGCVLSHSAAAAGIESMIQAEGRRQGEWRALQFSNYTFDASVLDIFNTLNSGGTLCMAPNERLLSDLPGVIEEMDVNHSFLTPTVARLISSSEAPTLKTMSIGGEPLTEDIIDLAAKSRVIQCYGPTETGMVITMRNMKPGDNPRNLGKPFDTVQVFVIEKDGSDLVPYGAIGELCIAGPQVGVGYLKRPDLTAAAFCETSLGGFGRMYRSGDLARWLPGGELECLGRKDNQVKINGHRIELGEIENAIYATGIVSQCVALVAQIGTKPQLAAFVVFSEKRSDEENILPAEDYIDNVAKLRQKLGGLAVYMYPKVVLPLGLIPKMPSGKSNRKLLKSWVEKMEVKDLSTYNFELFGSSALATIIPVTTEQERFLEQAFAKTLNMEAEQLGQGANFLTLGGDSISAINLCSFARMHGKLLSVGDILKFPRLRDMAEHLKESEGHEGAKIGEFEEPDLTERLRDFDLSREEVDYVYPCPPGQSEFLSQGNRKEQMWVLMTVRTLIVSSAMWIKAVERLTRTNDILRTTFTKVDGKWIGVVLKSSSLVVNFIDVSSEAEKRSEMDKIWNSSFVFGQPFIRYAFLSWPDGKLEIVTKMDHGLYDGTLLRVFASHFKELQHNRPAPEFTPFRDFSSRLWQSNNTRALEYWSEPSNSPTGFQFPSIKSSLVPSATSPIFVPFDIKLDTFASACGVTVPTVFQAAFQLWLAKSSGQLDVGFDYLYTGRNIDLPNPELINGVCANFLPLRSRVQLGTTVKDYLVATQDFFWNATDNGVVGMQEIYDAVGLEREVHGNKTLFLFQPFEPAPVGGDADGDMRWVYMAGSEVKMEQPYGLVCEVVKTLTGFKIKFTIDERVLSRDEAVRGAEEVWEILRKMVEDGAGTLGVEMLVHCDIF